MRPGRGDLIPETISGPCSEQSGRDGRQERRASSAKPRGFSSSRGFFSTFETGDDAKRERYGSARQTFEATGTGGFAWRFEFRASGALGCEAVFKALGVRQRPTVKHWLKKEQQS